MKIVVLDGYTLNPGDLDWSGLQRLGDVTVHEHTPAAETIARASGAQIVLTNKTVLGEAEISKLPALKYIGVLATGYNVVDTRFAAQRGIVVTNIPAYGTRSVAQMVFALILELCQHAQAHSDAVKRGEWSRRRDFCFWNYPLVELAGKAIGIIGFGRIGSQVADIAQAFGMDVIAYDSRQSDQSHRVAFRWASLEELFAQSDIVSLHCPLLPETRGLVNRETLKRMKPSAFLVNTSRGPLVVEEDLYEALKGGTIAGAALDVLSQEPPAESNPLFSLGNCLITPHISWATREARGRLLDLAVENVGAFILGAPKNIVL